MKLKIAATIAITVLAGCGRRQASDGARQPRVTVDALLKTTPVKDQGRSGLCWAYAMLATIETEHLMQGDSVNLSVDYVARSLIEEQASEAFLTRHGGISTRGVATMAIHLIETYGLTHYDAFHAGKGTDYNVIARKARLTALGSTTYDQFEGRLGALLDEAIHAKGSRVYMLGAVYTPLEFAHSVCRDDEYKAYTSFTHHPFGEPFALEIPDNRYHDAFMNVPIDTLMNIITNSIRSGHPVCWEGDIIEPGFDWLGGIADIDPPADGDIQAERQRAFERGLTTDDHCMEIVGIAHDAEGKEYFIMKNSWGTANRLHGFMLASFDYARLKTIAVVAERS